MVWGSGFKMLLPSRIMLCWRPMTTDNIRCSTCASWRQTGWTKTAGSEDLFCVRRSLFIYSCWNFFYEMVGLESTSQLQTEKLFFVESMWIVHPVILQCSGWVHDFVVAFYHSVVKSNGFQVCPVCPCNFNGTLTYHTQPIYTILCMYCRFQN